MEHLLDDISYTASDRGGETYVVTAAQVTATLGELAKNADLSKFIL